MARRSMLSIVLWLAACGGSSESAPRAVEPAPQPAAAAEVVAEVEAEAAPEVAPAAPARRWPLSIDTHVDTTQRMLDAGDDIFERWPDGHLDVPRMREGSLDAAFFSIWVHPGRHPGEQAWERAQALVAAVRAFAAAHPEHVALATTSAEVRRAREQGRVAVLMGIEGAHALGDAAPEVLFARLREMHALGVRYVTVTWTNDNVFAHASTGAHPRRGLTPLGRELVAEMNRLGVIVDVSHVSDQTVLDVLDVSSRPVLASHSSARALADHVRNIPDPILRRIGEAGGAVCINYYTQYLDPAYGERRRALEAEHRAEIDAIEGRSWQTWRARTELVRRLDPTLLPPRVSVLADHFAHVARIAGAGGVCLGSDFDGVSELPLGMEDASDLPVLFEELERRGLDMQLTLGENVLRVLDAQTAAPAP